MSRIGSWGIGARMIVLGVIVAVVVALVAGIAAFPLVRDSSEARARNDLARLADLTATTVSRDDQGQFVVPPRVGTVLEEQDVSAYVVFRGSSELPEGITRAQVDAVTTGRPISQVGTDPTGAILIEGRPLGRGVGVILVQSTAIAVAPALAVLGRIIAALGLGIAVAVIVAIIVSRRMTRSLRAVVSGADRLAQGDRDVVVTPEGPMEVAAIAESINRLTAALAASEGRQREFLLSVSHELKTPLTAVLGYAQAIGDGLITAADLPRTSAVMVDEARRLDRLVTDLLDLARLEAVDFSFTLVPLDIGDLLTQAAQVWRDRSQRVGVDFRLEMPGSDLGEAAILSARADPVRLRQIIDNLAENALRVTPEGGQIVLAGRCEGEATVVVEVRDTGPGLTLADLPDAFTPGVLHERYRGLRPVGTGVGLALVARLARGLGGRAEAGLAPEGGARFSVLLPRASRPDARLPSTTDETSA
jgi:two-component system, OmpR family, sensor kinase